MPSSISSSESAGSRRLTASDRPGVAQPVPVRDIPAQPWDAILLGMLTLLLVLGTAWELHWRAWGVSPGYRNSNGEWVQQRRRIDQGEGNKTVLTGASRVLFDVQLPVWERVAGERPIQLALEGTSPLPVVEDLANDPNFTGHLLIGVAPDVFFSGFAYRGDAVSYLHKQTPAQRSGDWLSKQLLEPYFAFYDPDFALVTVIQRQTWWPARPGLHADTRVRKLLMQEADRNSHMWSKLETDADYRALARRIWAEDFDQPPPNLDTPAKKQKVIDEQIARAVAAVAKLRARGVQVLFVRPPSIDAYHDFENKVFPRAQTWDVLLARTGAPGIHFEDYPELQGFEEPEWSHLKAADADRFTEALYRIIEQNYWHRELLR